MTDLRKLEILMKFFLRIGTFPRKKYLNFGEVSCSCWFKFALPISKVWVDFNEILCVQIDTKLWNK